MELLWASQPERAWRLAEPFPAGRSPPPPGRGCSEAIDEGLVLKVAMQSIGGSVIPALAMAPPWGFASSGLAAGAMVLAKINGTSQRSSSDRLRPNAHRTAVSWGAIAQGLKRVSSSGGLQGPAWTLAWLWLVVLGSSGFGFRRNSRVGPLQQAEGQL